MKKLPQYRLRAALSQCIAKRGFGFFDGGCLIFAEAAMELYPSSRIVTITRGAKRRADHYGLMIGDGLILDGDGFYENPDQWVSDFRAKENVSGAKLFFETELVSSEEIPRDPPLSKKIARVLGAA